MKGSYFKVLQNKNSPKFYCFGHNLNFLIQKSLQKQQLQTYTYISHSLHLFYTPKYLCHYHLPNC